MLDKLPGRSPSNTESPGKNLLQFLYPDSEDVAMVQERLNQQSNAIDGQVPPLESGDRPRAYILVVRPMPCLLAS
ncbi:MAG: hypothetical protein ACFE0I_25810 [Elainellaceae cyanobacterium]